MSAQPKRSSSISAQDEIKKGSKASPKAEMELDISKLHSLASEQQDQYLFGFVTSFENHIHSLSTSALIAQQAHIKKQLFQIITLQTPTPTRVVRNSLGRCFACLFAKGDRKLLFESITGLGELLTITKSNKDVNAKHAAVSCLGEIYKAAGDGAINLSSIICTSLTKLYKASPNNVSVRAAVFKTLGKIVSSVRGSLDENVARDVWKQGRIAAANDRGAIVQINACWCLEQLTDATNLFTNTNDFDSLKTAVWKAGDSLEPRVRHASASCLASIMVKAYSETGSVVPLPWTPKAKKSKKLAPGQVLNGDDAEDSDSSSRVSSPTWKKNSLILVMTLSDILRQLSSQYIRSSTSNRCRATIIACYSKVFQKLDASMIEASFDVIAEHLLTDLFSNSTILLHRYRVLLTRRFAQKLLADVIGRQILGEAAQINCARVLINMLKEYPSTSKDKPDPSKNMLTGALNALASFIGSLGSAFSPLADGCLDALINVLEHPSYTVQIHASYCLRAFTLACPRELIQCASICMNRATRELSQLGTEIVAARRSLGYANGLSAVLSVSSLQPLYSSLEISSRVLRQATGLLKTSVKEDLRVSGAQVQVAWVMIGGLMSLGPNFVEIHLTQLLLLWRNSLPKPLSRENTSQRQPAELSYLVHVRECALGSMLSFLEYNSRLLTSDISKRITVLLQNTIEFLGDLPPVKMDGEISQKINPSLQLYELVQMVRRRVLQCFARLATRAPNSSKEVLSQANILAFAEYCFAEPDAFTQESVGASIASSAANFESIWAVADNMGFGISGLMRGLDIRGLPEEQNTSNKLPWHRQNQPSGDFDSLILSPICGSREHDSVYMHLVDRNGVDELPDPPATEVVNSAITVFAMTLPLQDPIVQKSVLERLFLSLSAKSLMRDPGRKAAITVNIALALLGALKVSLGETPANQGDLKSPATETCLDEVLRTLIIDPDKYVRNAAYEALGRLCNGSGNTFTTKVVNSLVETIVANREPNARAGCAMALASIHSSVGGMAAGFHLKKIHSILMSLCGDPHPTVHFWAIEALSKVAESAGLTFSGYIPSTLGLLAQLWISDSHCNEADAIGTSNAELEMPTPAAIAHTIASLINVLGPDLQDISKTRDLILSLVRQFDLDDLSLVQGQALHCWEYIYLYAPSYVDYKKYVRQLQYGLSASSPSVFNVAVEGLRNLFSRDVDNALQAAERGIEDQIWSLLDGSDGQEQTRALIQLWVDETCLSHTTEWISRCQDILTKTVMKLDGPRTSEPKADQATSAHLQDDEVAGFAVHESKDGEDVNGVVGVELLKWQVRAFALQCLISIFATGAKSLQANPDSTAGHILQQRVADIIRMAFLASTSPVVELRIDGLRLINQVLTVFGKTPDPDFAEALLLEQYQAQISSALTPAFGVDSTPELASAAINVCATFIATGLVTDVERMGRILKLLVSSLASFSVTSEDPAVGDLKGLSTNAQKMVKMAVLSAWAELQVASTEQEYLVDVVKPHIVRLTPLWLSSLQDYARLRFEPDISSTATVSLDDSLDTVYAALNRQTLLKFFQDSWLTLVNAIASLIDQDSDFVFDALDRKDEDFSPTANQDSQKSSDINYRDEPVAFFFVLYGIVSEALIARPGNNAQNDNDHTLEILIVLKKILRPSVCGHAIYQDVVFSETMDMFDRLVQTEGLAVQSTIVEITRNLCLSHPSVEGDATDEHLSDDIEQLFELTRIMVLVLVGILPNLGEKSTILRHQVPEDAAALINLSINALVDAADVFPSIIRTDLHACIIHIFTTILGTGACQATIVPEALPVFKRFIQTIVNDPEENTSLSDHLRACLQRFRSILSNAQRRESETSLKCAQNTLMASVILLANGSEGIPLDEPALMNILEDLLDCLQDIGLGKVAGSCMRSLLLVEPKGPSSQAIANFVLPRMIHFIVDESQSDPESTKSVLMQALVSYLASLRGDNDAYSTVLCIVLPALLQRAYSLGNEAHADIGSKLLSVAGTNQAAFKGMVDKLSAGQRATMEEVIRSVGWKREKGNDSDDSRGNGERGEPSIALKLNFG